MTITYSETIKNKTLVPLSEKGQIEQEDKMAEQIEWKEVESGNLFVFQQVGDTIEGVLVAKRQSSKYETGAYDIQTKEGLRTIFGTAILDTRLQKVEVNAPVKIEYVGELKTGTGRLAKNFKVFTSNKEGPKALFS